MKFRTTMWSLPAMAGVLLGLGLCVATVQGWKTSRQLDTLQNASFPYLERVLRVDRAVNDLRAALQAAALEDNADKLEDAKAPALAAEAALKESEQLAGHADRAAKLASAFGTYRDAATAATRAMLDKKPDAALPKQMASALTTLSALLKSEEVSARADVQSGFKSVGQSRSLSQWSGVGVTVAALLALGLAARFIVSSVWRQLGDEPEALRLTVERVAAGDLQVRIRVEEGDCHSLNAAVAAMAERLRETVQQIRSASDTISTASGEIAAGNQDLSNRTETQRLTFSRRPAGWSRSPTWPATVPIRRVKPMNSLVPPAKRPGLAVRS